MVLLTGSLAGDLAATALLLAALFYAWWSHVAGYWRRRGVPYLRPFPLIGNTGDRLLLRRSLGEMMTDFYKRLDGHRFGGFFQSRRPILLLRDPELIKHVLIKDFGHFQERGFFVDEKRNPLSAHLFSLEGPRWRKLRLKLSPTFTSGKMKMMFRLMEECAKELRNFLAEEARPGQPIEMKDVVGKFTTDVIGTCAFGLQFNSMKDPDSEFRRMGKAIFEPSMWVIVRTMLNTAMPFLSKLFRISFPSREVSNFFLRAVKETVDYREKNGVKRNDFMQLLIELKNRAQLLDDYEQANGTPPGAQSAAGKDDAAAANRGKEADDIELTDHLLAAQAFVFFVAGYETSATTLSFALHELALHPEIQARLREEVDRVLEEHGGRFSYDSVMKMEYLDRVVSETLRMYPPLPTLQRRCTASYRIPDSDVTLERGTLLMVPVHALHRDPKYFPDPERFDPERFSEEIKSQRPNYTYLPFGDGPRNCIGLRFGQLQARLGLAMLVHSFEFSACEKTIRRIKLDPKAIFNASVGGNWLRVTARF